jgi:hypothetical protein
MPAAHGFFVKYSTPVDASAASGSSANVKSANPWKKIYRKTRHMVWVQGMALRYPMARE